jgi:hypothetical protein
MVIGGAVAGKAVLAATACDSDQDLFRSRHGIGQVSKLKHERRPEFAHFDGTHGDQAPSAASAGPMSRASKPG